MSTISTDPTGALETLFTCTHAGALGLILGFSRSWFHRKSTSAVVTATPSDHFRPSRILKVKTLLSALALQLSTQLPRRLPFAHWPMVSMPGVISVGSQVQAQKSASVPPSPPAVANRAVPP